MPSNEWNDAADQALAEMNRDDRVGKHLWTVQDVAIKTWDDGRQTYNLTGTLDTARGAKVRADIGATLYSKEEIEANKGVWDDKRAKGIRMNQNMRGQLAKNYDVKSLDAIKPGSRFEVEVVLNKEGFARIVAFLPKGTVGAKASEATSEAVPF